VSIIVAIPPEMATSFLPRKSRSADADADTDNDAEPGWLRRQVTVLLQSVSRRACVHPIHTIVVIALLASTTYVGLLEGSIFDAFRNSGDTTNQLDVNSFLHGSRTLRLGQRTAWRWQVEDNLTLADDKEVSTKPFRPHSKY
jgi:hydroxymethylglutaryl-CoA reductase (NADPH)